MLRIGVLVSGGGTNLQAIIDALKAGIITNASIEIVISNNPNAYALERAKNNGINAECIRLRALSQEKNLTMHLLTDLMSVILI